MEYANIIEFMFIVIVVIMGWAVWKMVKRFFIGLKIPLLCALPLVFVEMYIIMELCISNLNLYADYLGIKKGTSILDWIMDNIPNVLIWVLVATFVLFVLFVYVAATLNYRKNANNIYVAFGGPMCVGMVIGFCSAWGFYGLSTFIQLSQRYSDEFPIFAAVLATIILTDAVLVAWIIFSSKSKLKGWKMLSVQVVSLAGIYATIWLLAFAAAYTYGRYATNQAHKNGVVPSYYIWELPNEAQAENDKIEYFLKKHQDFALPYESDYKWTNDGCDGYGPIPQSKREYTLKLFNSADFNQYCRSYEKLLEDNKSGNKNILYSPILNSMRSCARIYAGKAALYKETNQPEKILPELMKITSIDADLLNNSPFLIVELLRNACRTMWHTAIVQLGPNDKKYAPIYREALDFMKSRKVHLPHEAGYFLHMLSNDIYELFNTKPGSYIALLAMPPTMTRLVKGVLNSLAIRPKLKELENKEVFEDNEKQSHGIPSYYWSLALKSRTSIVVGTTALALKLYRVEHGTYPDKLEQLVPEYLDKIPLCPILGEPLKYESDGINFTISYSYAKKKPNALELTSNPNY